MNAQSGSDKLPEAFTATSTAPAATSHELALIANVPTFNEGQRIFGAIKRLTTSVDSLKTDLNTLRTDMNSKLDNLELRMRTDMTSKFDSLELRMSVDSLNHTARVYNSHISSRDTPLRALRDRRNTMVEGFPSDSASLMRLQGNPLTTLLNAFELPTDGNIESKRKRLREFVGLVTDA